jgi:hypothetical protein
MEAVEEEIVGWAAEEDAAEAVAGYHPSLVVDSLLQCNLLDLEVRDVSRADSRYVPERIHWNLVKHQGGDSGFRPTANLLPLPLKVREAQQ